MSLNRHVAAMVITLCAIPGQARAQVGDVVEPEQEQDEGQPPVPEETPPREEVAPPIPDEPEEKKAKKDKKKKHDGDDESADEHGEKKKKKDKKVDAHVPEIGGYLQVSYQRPFDTNDDGSVNPDELEVRRLRLKVSGKVMKKVQYNVEIDPVARDFSDLLRDAYLELKQLPGQDILIGQQKTQFGFENNESSGKLYVINRADLSEELARGNTLRDLGVGLIGDIPLAAGFSIEDAITVVNGAGQNTPEDTSRKNVFGRLGARYENLDLDLDVRVGGSAATGDLYDLGTADPLDDHRYTFRRFGADLQVDHTYGFVAAEYVTGTDKDLATDVKTQRDGWYVLAAGKTPWHAGPVVRYDTLEDESTITFGGYWGELGAHLRVMAEYERRESKDDRLIVWTQGRF